MRHVHKAKSRDRALSPEEIRLFLTAAFESNIRRQFKIGLQLILLTMPDPYSREIRTEKTARAYAHIYDRYHGAGARSI